VLPPGLLTGTLPDSAWLAPPAEASALTRATAPPGGLSFWLPRGSETGQRVAEFVQATLARHGVRVRIESRPWPEFERGLKAGSADLFYLSWYADSPDAWRFLAALVASPAHGGQGNHTFYANAALDSVFDAARDRESYAQNFRELERLERVALSDTPLLPLFHGVNVTLVRPWVVGYVPDLSGCPRYDTVEVRHAH
jgi:ABC-type transport system substrate-binding protein